MSLERPGAPASMRMPAINQASTERASAGRLICAPEPETCACGPLAMARNCWKTASGQMGSRLVGSWGFGVVTSATAMRLAKSAALVGAGKSQETSLAESGALGGIWAMFEEGVTPGFSWEGFWHA